jgi:hypothetical protein
MKKYSFGNSGLLKAVENNDIAEVQSLLDAGAMSTMWTNGESHPYTKLLFKGTPK